MAWLTWHHTKFLGVLEFAAELPKTINGKIRRIELRATQEQQQAPEGTRTQEYYL